MGYSAKNIKEFVKGSGILVASNIILKAIQFFLLPLYTNYLSPSELGVSDSITSFTSFLFPLLVMAFDSAFSAFFYEEDGKEYQTRVFNTVFFFLAVQGLIPVIMILGSGFISQVLFGTAKYSLGITLALFSVSTNLWYLSFALLTRMENRMRTFALINVSSSTTMIILNILFVSVLKWGYMALLASSCIVNVLQVALYLITCKVSIRRSYIDKPLFGKMFRYAVPLIPMTVSTWILNMSDRYMLLYFCGEAEVGIYGIGGRFITVLSVVISGISTAYTSFAFKSHRDEAAKEMFADVVKLLFVFLAGICATVALFGKEIIYLMTSSEYHSSYLLLPSMMFSQLAYALYTFTGYGIAFKKKPKYYFYSVTAGAVINVILNVFLLPEMGAVGAALTTLIGTVLMFAISYYYSQKLYPCHYGIIKISLIFIMLYMISILFRETILPIKIGIWFVAAAGTIGIYYPTIKAVIVSLRSKN